MNIAHSSPTLLHSLHYNKGSFWNNKVIRYVRTVPLLMDGIKDRKVREKTIIRDRFRTDRACRKVILGCLAF